MSPPCQPASEKPLDSDTSGSDSDTPPGNQAKRPKLATKPAQNPAAKKGPAKKGTAKKSKRSSYTMKAVHTYFTGLVCFAVSQLYRLAVYDNTEAGPRAQSKAVKAVLWHELDRPDSTKEERDRYHEYCCPSWCPYKKWVTDGQPGESFVRLFTKDSQGKSIPWKGGYYARLDVDYPDAFQGVADIFDTVGSLTLMNRCKKKVTQNLNESVHSKLWRKVLKYKFHRYGRYRFACVMVMMEHNFGRDKGSLLHCLASMTKPAQSDLRYKDKESINVASRKHNVVPGGARTKHRTKSSSKGYDAGMEEIVRRPEEEEEVE